MPSLLAGGRYDKIATGVHVIFQVCHPNLPRVSREERLWEQGFFSEKLYVGCVSGENHTRRYLAVCFTACDVRCVHANEALICAPDNGDGSSFAVCVTIAAAAAVIAVLVVVVDSNLRKLRFPLKESDPSFCQ